MDIKFFSDRSAGVLLAAVMILFMWACKKTNGSSLSEQTLKAFFNGSAHYTLFNHALQRAHLDSLLGETDPYTVFAADDSAMSRAGYSATGIDSLDPATLTGILLYHLVPGTIASTDVQLYKETYLTTADSNFQSYLEYNNFGLFYNGIPLVSVDNRLVNGLVQGISTLARPPIGDLVTTIANTPGLSDYSYVVSQSENLVNLGFFNNLIIPYISGTSAAPITVFLPDDKTFALQGLDSYSAILHRGGGPSAFMSQGQFFTSDFLGKNTINEFVGTYPIGVQLWFSADGSSFFRESGASLEGQYRIVQSNIVATNGVIHVIESY